MKAKSSFSRRLLINATAAGASVFAVWCGLTGFAAYANFRAESYTEAWQNQSETGVLQATPVIFLPTLSEIDTATRFSAMATRISPHNGDFHRVYGDILIWKAQTLASQPNQALTNQAGADALNEYRTAAQIRPTWPGSHTSLLVAKLMLGQIDPEFSQALTHANRYGAWDPQTIFAVSSAGLTAWPKLDATARKAVSQSIMNAQNWNLDEDMNRHSSLTILNMITARGMRLEICPQLDQSNTRVNLYCNPPPVKLAPHAAMAAPQPAASGASQQSEADPRKIRD